MHIDSSLTPFFAPHGVALVGASTNPMKLGFGLARNLLQSHYRGAIHFVNPAGGALLGRPLYTSLAQIPDPVDLAVLLVPAAAAPQALRECAQRGIRAVIIASGGFREVGPEGAALEADCLAIAREHGLRLIGPNCIGLLDTHLPLDTTFLPPPGPTPGDVAFISHSGAICAAVIDWARGQGFGLSRLVSLGNQVDVGETDVLAPVAADPDTRVITLYMEGVQDGRRFIETAQAVTREKPIVALKVGRSLGARQAVASHTGALAGEDSAFTAAFRQAGIIRADTSEELFDWARALAWCPLPKGRRVAVLTNAGGPGVTAIDALDVNKLVVAPLTEATRQQLQEVLPPAANVHNPVDMLAGASPEQYAACLRILLADEGVDSVLVILPPPPMHTAGAVARTLIPLIYSSEKPVVIALMGERLIQEAVEHFRAARVPEYRFPERAAAALAILSERAEYLAGERQEAVRPRHIDHHLAETILRDATSDGFLPPQVVNDLLRAYGIPVPEMGLARTPQEAVQWADRVGYPVVLKIVAPEIVHKSDIGCVQLNLADEVAVREAYQTIMTNGRQAQPAAAIEGVSVQPMIPTGQEVIIGAVQDPQFGAMVMFGSGGVEVEQLKDVAFALAPLTETEAARMLSQTWAGRRLQGYRHLPPGDQAQTIAVLLRLGQLAADWPQLAEIEINPLRVLVPGKGVMAVDARARLQR
ncbi:MAG: acetate--CoA ligase family protein [Chloroflexi bacterium]|nr:acetate--CoA ligase family protein [Chloroflexota bacterium]